MKRMSGQFSVMVLLMLVVLVPAVAGFAADAANAEPSAPAVVADFLRDTVFPIIGSILMGVITVFLQRLGTKYKIDALTQKDNFLSQLAFQGITLAEEKAAQLVGSKSALTGNQKLDIAVAHILTAMPKVSPERAKAITEATLAQIPGIGATGEQAFSLGPILAAATAPLAAAVVAPVPTPGTDETAA